MIKETLDVIKKGYYKCENLRVNLSINTGVYNYEMVEVYSPTQLVDIFCDSDHFMKEKFYEPYNHTVKVAVGASYEIAKDYLRPLILNTADAISPGGGCINAKKTSESKLVIATSLYQSLSSQEASQVYLFNEHSDSPMYSDFMLLSKEIAVFRDANYRFLLHPYPVSVLSMMPVNRNKIPRSETKEYEINTIMKMRIRLFFHVAARNMYRNLILVPSGFEDYGYSAYTIAQCLYEILIKEEYIDYFEHIVFTFDPEFSKSSMQIFEQMFHCDTGCKQLTCSNDRASRLGLENKSIKEPSNEVKPVKELPSDDKSIQAQSISKQILNNSSGPDYVTQRAWKSKEKKYIQARYPFPECNYTIQNNSSSAFLGYAQGIFEDGVPFVAELMQTKNQKITAVFILPFLDHMNQKSQIANNNDTSRFSMKKYDKNKPVDIWNSVLCQGMQHYDQELKYEVIDNYLNYLVCMNLLDLQKSDIEGFAHVLYDRAGHKVVAIEITLKKYTQGDTIVPLSFQPFMREMITEDKIESRLRIT